jgi:hypothetical protein
LFGVSGLGLNNEGLSTAEVLTEKGWKQVEPSLPVNILGHCMVHVNATTVMVIGGIQNGTQNSNGTYILNTGNEQWRRGPNLKYGQARLLCGKLRTNSLRSEGFSVIVVGSFNSKIQLLDKLEDDWHLGLELPRMVSLTTIDAHREGGKGGGGGV